MTPARAAELRRLAEEALGRAESKPGTVERIEFLRRSFDDIPALARALTEALDAAPGEAPVADGGVKCCEPAKYILRVQGGTGSLGEKVRWWLGDPDEGEAYVIDFCPFCGAHLPEIT